jgi:four helix bundle protein
MGQWTGKNRNDEQWRTIKIWRYGSRRRSAISIPSNIAEGAARSSDKAFIQFLYVTLGSIAELDTQYILSKEIQLTGGSAKVE